MVSEQLPKANSRRRPSEASSLFHLHLQYTYTSL